MTSLSPLAFTFGTIEENPISIDLSDKNIILVGTSDSGKEAVLDNVLLTLLSEHSPEEVRFVLYENESFFSHYDGIPHLLTATITDTDKSVSALKWIEGEIDSRYKLFRDQRVRAIEEYNENAKEPLPHILFIIKNIEHIIDAYSVGRDAKDILDTVISRCVHAGIHFILVTDRLSHENIPTNIASNVSARIVFHTASTRDSSLAGVVGASQLPKGIDCIYRDIPSEQVHLTVSSVDEITKLHQIEEVRNKYPQNLSEKVVERPLQTDGFDSLLEQAEQIVRQDGKASASLIQRRLSIGYARAARIMDQLESQGILGPENGSKPREVVKK